MRRRHGYDEPRKLRLVGLAHSDRSWGLGWEAFEEVRTGVRKPCDALLDLGLDVDVGKQSIYVSIYPPCDFRNNLVIVDGLRS